MSILHELGIDAIGEVHLPQDGWQVAARKMIDNRKKQVAKAFKRAKTERQEEALYAELERMVALESYVRACENGDHTQPRDLALEELARMEQFRPLFRAALEGKTWDELQAMKARLEASSQPEPEAHYVATNADIPF